MTTPDDSIYAYTSKEHLTYVICFLAITVLPLFSTLINHRIFTEIKARKKKRFYDKYRSAIVQCLENGRPIVGSPKSNLQYEAFADVCIHLLSKSSENAANKIKALLKETAAVEHFIALSASSSWARRFYAVETLGFFMIDDLKDVFTERIRTDEISDVKAKAVWALSLIADRESLEVITRALSSGISKSSKFNKYIYTNMLDSLRRNNLIDALLNYLDEIKEDQSIPLIVKRDLIAACDSSVLKKAGEVIHDYLALYLHDFQMRVVCIRALGATGRLTAATTLVGLSDDDWRIRAVTAKATSVAHDTVLSLLKGLLYDPVYIVRINAARKLADLGEKGISILEREMKSQDRYVRDTVRFILDKAEAPV